MIQKLIFSNEKGNILLKPVFNQFKSQLDIQFGSTCVLTCVVYSKQAML